ncbi:MAG: cobalamin B12-binding domain-containing protein, partial [Polyangiaceae bacterium]|nr:cobalamin B12-binding domain-containing protein [Polyangiaceae bacterium]
MKILLIYPPPWKIPNVGEVQDCSDGPPSGYGPADLDGDFFQMPYGLLTLATVVRAAGHRVKLLNLSCFPWNRVEQTIRSVEADVYGMSCYTANRRGVAVVAA